MPAGDLNPLDTSGPDPNDDADMDIPDQQALLDAFMAGLCKESDSDFRSLSTLLATLPDPTGTHGEVESMSFAEATARGCIPEASDETLQAFTYSEMKLSSAKRGVLRMEFLSNLRQSVYCYLGYLGN
jgi:hypothetical protein